MDVYATVVAGFSVILISHISTSFPHMSSDDEPIPDLVLPASTAVHSNVQEHRAKGAIAGHSPYIKPVPVTLITG